MRHGIAWSRRYRADLAALLVVTIWGVNFAFMKAALEQFDVWAFTGLRLLGMLVLGWGVLVWRIHGATRGKTTATGFGLRRADLPLMVLTGGLGYLCYIPLNTLGLSYTTAFSTALLIGTAPLFAAILLRGFGLERVTLAQWLAMLIALVGVVLFVFDKLNGGLGMAGLGDVLSLGSAVFFAAYNVASKPLLARYSVTRVITYTLTLGSVPVVLFSLPAMMRQDWSAVTAVGWAALLWTIVLPVYLAWTVWAWASDRAGVGHTTVFMYLVPVVGGIASWLLLGESFGVLKVVGGLLVVGGLVLARQGTGQQAASRPAANVATAPAAV